MNTGKLEIIESMKPVIEEARRQRKWLLSTYHDIWLTPDELEKHQEAGSFCWGPPNWQLRDPHDLLERANGKVIEAQRHAAHILKRIADWEETA